MSKNDTSVVARIVAYCAGITLGVFFSGFIALQIAGSHEGLFWWIVFLAVWAVFSPILSLLSMLPFAILALSIDSLLNAKRK